MMLTFVQKAIENFPQLHLPQTKQANEDKYFKRMVSFYAAFF